MSTDNTPIHLGKPRLNTIDEKGTQAWQRAVYATAAEARISGSGWLYWMPADAPEAG